MARPVQSRCFPKNLVESFKPDPQTLALQNIHKSIALRTPFYHLINIPPIGGDRPRLSQLCQYWRNGSTFIIKGVKLLFTPADVAILLGLPNRGMKVDLEDIGDIGDGGDGSVMNRHFSGHNPTIDQIKTQMRKIRPDDDSAEEYVKLWVMYIFCVLLFTESSQRSPISINLLVDNLDELYKYDWPTAIHKFTIEGIQRFRAGKNTYLRGCPVLITVSDFFFKSDVVLYYLLLWFHVLV